MSCINCTDQCKWTTLHSCRVCVLLDGDNSIKRVCWCAVCKAHICKEDWNNSRRLKAIVITAKQAVVDKIFPKPTPPPSQIIREGENPDEKKEETFLHKLFH